MLFSDCFYLCYEKNSTKFIFKVCYTCWSILELVAKFQVSRTFPDASVQKSWLFEVFFKCVYFSCNIHALERIFTLKLPKRQWTLSSELAKISEIRMGMGLEPKTY